MSMQQAFLQLRPQMLNEQCRDCFDILSPYFPAIPPELGMLAVNMQTGYKQEGTGICNYNMLPAEALSVADTIKEIDCGCIFIVPVPVSGLFTEEYLGVGAGSASYAERILLQVRAGFALGNEHIKFPPYFSVHMEGAAHKGHCRARLKELLVQNLHVRNPACATISTDTVSTILSRFTLTPR